MAYFQRGKNSVRKYKRLFELCVLDRVCFFSAERTESLNIMQVNLVV